MKLWICASLMAVPGLLAVLGLSSVSLADEPAGRPRFRDRVRNKLREKIEEEKEAAAPEDGSTQESGERPPAGTDSRSFSHGDRKRSYRLHMPPTDSTEPLPLVVVLHGAGANGRIMEGMSGFNAVADKHGFIVAYPDGVASIWRFWERLEGVGQQLESLSPEGSKNGAPRGIDDIGFLEVLIDRLVDEGLADPRRIYMTGISNGAYMTNRVVCEFGDKIAAVAPIAGTLPKGVTDKIGPPRPIPCLYMHGTADRIVGIDGVDTFTRALAKNGLSLSAVDLMTWWSTHNRCATKPVSDNLADAKQDGTKVLRHTYEVQDGGVPTLYYEITGGGHTWPGGFFQPELLLGKTCQDISASEAIWEFCSQFTLPEKKE